MGNVISLRTLLPLSLALAVTAAPARAVSVGGDRTLLCLQPRGAEVGTSLLLKYYGQLPEPRDGEDARAWAARLEDGLQLFKKNVAGRYNEGTLQRLADHPSSKTRRAALLALHLGGTMASNEAVAGRLRDEDPQVRQMAADALWAIWFRAGGEANNKALHKALQQTDPKKAVAELTALIREAPDYAEAYNQRGILYFQMQEYEKCVADCEKVMRLNKQHFGAASGLGRCYLRLRLPEPALKAFRTAYKINPNLDGVEDAIRDLESVLGGDDGK